MRGETVQGYETERVAKNGRRLHVSITATPMRDRDGGVIGVSAILRDIGARKQAEAALQESEARFRVITDAMPQIVWSTRPDGYHDYYNQRWYELTGTTPQEALGEGWNPVFHPEDRELARIRWQHSLRTGEPYEIEYRLRMADGSYRWMLGRARAIRDEQGRISRWFGTCTDIEDTVAAREALAQSREELERLIGERTRELEATQGRLAHAQRMEALGQLAGGIAHDFNNVLQAVQGGTRLIERRPEDAEKVRRLSRMVIDAAERGSAITSRLLAFARRGDLRAEPLDAAGLLEGMREILAHTLGGAIQVRVAVAPELPAFVADKAQLETVLVNLATNARDPMEAGKMLSFTADAEPGPSSIPYGGAARSCVRLSVTDTGTGMTREVLGKAAEPFFTTKAHGKGTGLGLAMARGFAEQSGGALEIESAPGRGTTIRLWFPAATPGPAAPGHLAADEPSAPRRSAGACVLVVDDEALVRETIAEQLRDAGYAVLSASSGPEALRKLAAGAEVDLVVSDLSMPEMDGLSLIRRLRATKGGLPAILLTGYPTGAAENAFREALNGAVTLVRKPASGAELTVRIAALLEGPEA